MFATREYTRDSASDVMPAGRRTEVIYVDLDNVPVSLIGYHPL